MQLRQLIVGISLLAGASMGASGAILPYGTYSLANHPDGNLTPPPYGLRLDGLFNATAQSDRFTFDFDDAQSNMKMTISNNGVADIITIFGESYGGRDIGSTYASDSWLGVYQIYFQYTIGVAPMANDDDWRVAGSAEMQNFGQIIAPGGQQANLTDKSDGSQTFRVGDENNDLGHRRSDGLISGWGWLAIQQSDGSYLRSPEGGSDDWLFTVVVPTPLPGFLAVAGLGGLAAIRRRPLR